MPVITFSLLISKDFDKYYLAFLSINNFSKKINGFTDKDFFFNIIRRGDLI